MTPPLSRVGFHWRATFQHDNVPDWETWLAEIKALGIGTLFICHDISGMRNYDPATQTLDPNRIPRDARPGIEGMIRDLLAIGVVPALRLSDAGGIRAGSIPNTALDGSGEGGRQTHPSLERAQRRPGMARAASACRLGRRSIEWALPACRHGITLGMEMSLPPINPARMSTSFNLRSSWAQASSSSAGWPSTSTSIRSTASLGRASTIPTTMSTSGASSSPKRSMRP